MNQTNQTAHTIAQFIERFPMSLQHFYSLQREGRAPDIIRVGKRKVLITEAAIQQWLDGMTASK